MSALLLFNNLRNYLNVSLEVPGSSFPGSHLNVGEQFTLRIKVTNTAPTGMLNPTITFRNIRITVTGSVYATPVEGNTIVVNLDDQMLTQGGDSGQASVRMRANSAILGPADVAPLVFPENFATVTVEADIDQNAFFRIKRKETAITDIKAT
ncbi:MAG: hypothetical protein ACLFUB_05920 [Cyclobacteriaceae bacterium]